MTKIFSAVLFWIIAVNYFGWWALVTVLLLFIFDLVFLVGLAD